MESHPDVLIAGGGIIGLTSAYFLAKAGLSVEVRDRGDLGRQASWAGAGIIPPGNPECTTNTIDRFRAESVRMFPEFTAELRERTGIDTGFHICGGIEFLEDDETSLPLSWQQERIGFEQLSPEALRKLEPGLVAPDRRGFHFPEMGQVRNPWHLRALIEACRQLGVRLRPHTPFAWTDAEHAGQVLIATGTWAEELLAPLGCRPGVHPVRGQIVLFRPEQSVLSRVVQDGKLYLVPRADGRVLVGSTEEPEAGFEVANTEVAIRNLIEFGIRMVPALANAPIEKTWAGLRPGSPDGLPFLGRVPGHDRVMVAAGHFRTGVQLSLATARIVTDLATGAPPSIPIDAFRIDRVPDPDVRPAFRS